MTNAAWRERIGGRGLCGFAVPWGRPAFDVSTHCYKYVRYLLEDEIEELYDLEVDPQELHNLAGDPQHHKRLADLRRRLADELRRTGAPLVRNLPEPRIAGAAEE